jgi:hypothetical protein
MSVASLPSRSLVIPVDFTDSDDKAIAFALDSLYKKGDAVHLVHVLRIRETTNEIFHGVIPALGER